MMTTTTCNKDSEKYIERYLCQQVQGRGGLSLKYSNPGLIGFPDRICLLPGGVVFWVELKSRGRKPTRIQQIRIAALRALGQQVHVIDSISQIDDLLNKTLNSKL